MSEIFISYRQGDPNGASLKNFLEKNLYPDVAFLDTDNDRHGDLTLVLKEGIKNARYMLVLISRQWWDLIRDRLARERPPAGREDRDAPMAQDIAAESETKTELLFQNVLMELEYALDEKKDLIPVYVGNINQIEIDRQLREIEQIAEPGDRKDDKRKVINLLGQLKAKVWVDAKADRHLTMENLGLLLKKLKPGLPAYWRRVACRRLTGMIAALVACGLLVLLIVLTFGTGFHLKIHNWLIETRKPHPGGEIALSEYVLPHVNDSSAASTKHQLEMDKWFYDLAQQGVKARNRKDQRFVAVFSTPFDKSYETFSADIVPKDFNIIQAYAFLVSNAGPVGTYRPLYQQIFKFPIECRGADANCPIYRQIQPKVDRAEGQLRTHPMSVVNPNSGERLLIFFLAQSKQPGAVLGVCEVKLEVL